MKMKLRKPENWEAKIHNFVTPKLSSSESIVLLSLIRNLIKAENKEWREGRRCEICGDAKQSNMTSMCDDCWKNS